MTANNESDLITRLRQEWEIEQPELDSSAMDVVGRVIHLADQWQSSANKLLVQYELSYTEFDLVATLKRSGPPYELTPTKLRQSVLLTSGAMTAALNRVERKGLISRHAMPEDGRVFTAKLTTKGKKLAAKATHSRFELAQSQIKKLSEVEKSQLIKLLNRLFD